MKFTFDWLKDHLRTDMTYLQIAEKLTTLGIEVEDIIDNRKKYKNFVVGFIERAEKHPDADRLRVCQVNIGEKTLQIVCGAPNARAGIHVAVALVGAIIPAHGDVLKKGKIRGIESHGMMCSSQELLLGEESDGIIELPATSIPGQELATALGIDDVIFDVSVTPNRADCFSVRGIARDLSAIGAGDLLELDKYEIAENIENPVDIEIDTPNCDYFSTIAVCNVSGKTPDYISKRLKAVGQNVISLPVDIANYVCLDIGQPLHIYDLDKLPLQLKVRESRQGEMLETLNNKQTILPEGAVVVVADDDVLSIAGIMGGVKTGYSANTKNILLECAYFDKIAIAKAGQILKINSDARTRFERGIDPQAVDIAIKYVAKLISKCCDCRMSNIKKYGRLPKNEHVIELTYKKFNATTGLSQRVFENAQNDFVKLGITVKSMDSEKMILKTPSWRHDLEIDADMIEEILRLQGYENIREEELPIQSPKLHYYNTDKISDALVYNGFYEIKTFSFLDENTAQLFADDSELINLQDSSSEFSSLRPTIIASHLKAIKNAQNKSQKNLKFFEIGKCFRNEQGRVVEQRVLAVTMSDKFTSRNWEKPQKDVSIFDAKSILERLLNMLDISYRLQTSAPYYYHPGRSGTYIYQKDTAIAYFGEIHPNILVQMDINVPVVCFELFLDNLSEFAEQKDKKPLKISQYQPTTRDFSFVVKNSISAMDIINAIKKLRIEEMQDIKIFDIYESETLGAGNKAIAFELLLQSQKSTLSEERIKEISGMVTESIEKKCGGQIRQ